MIPLCQTEITQKVGKMRKRNPATAKNGPPVNAPWEAIECVLPGLSYAPVRRVGGSKRSSHHPHTRARRTQPELASWPCGTPLKGGPLVGVYPGLGCQAIAVICPTRASPRVRTCVPKESDIHPFEILIKHKFIDGDSCEEMLLVRKPKNPQITSALCDDSSVEMVRSPSSCTL